MFVTAVSRPQRLTGTETFNTKFKTMTQKSLTHTKKTKKQKRGVKPYRFLFSNRNQSASAKLAKS